MNLNFTFIGAGSTSFTLRLLGDIFAESISPDNNNGFISGGELRLVDTNPVVLDEVYAAVCKMVKSSGLPFKVSKHTDFKDAIPGVDFVFFTFVTGAFPSWEQDIAICTKHGVLQSVGDTIGPGGIIRALRNVPVVVEIARYMEQTAPEAWIINYSNPEGALSLAIEKYSKIRTFGLCHGTPNTAQALAEKVFKVAPEKLKYRAAGINHLTWLTHLTIDGTNVYPDLRRLLRETGYDKEEPVSAQLLDWFGLYPAPGDRHVQEFFANYLRPDVLREQSYTWGNCDMEQIKKGRERSLARVAKLMSGEITHNDIGRSGETSTYFMRALLTGEPTLEMANVINRGYIDNISNDVVVEVPCFVDNFGLHPQKIGSLPYGIAAKCDAVGREYNLAVDAAVYCDRNMALQAMMLDPLAAHCDYPERLLDELILNYIDKLPNGWRKYYGGIVK